MEQNTDSVIPNASVNTISIIHVIKKFFYICLRKWYVLCIFGIIGFSLGVGYAWLKKAKYEARITFALEDSQGGLGAALGLANELGFGLGFSGKSVFEGDNILVIFKSRRIIERVLLLTDTLNGKEVPMIEKWLYINDLRKNKRLKGVSFPANADRKSFNYLQDSILFTVYEDIEKKKLSAIRPDRKLNIYEIRFSSPQEHFSQLFTKRLVNETINFYTELRTKKSKETLNILESRVNSIVSSAKGAIDDQATIRDVNINPAFSIANSAVLKRQIDISAYGKAYEELFKNLEIARYQYLNDIPLLQVVDDAEYPMKKIKPGRLKTGIILGMLFGFMGLVYLFFSMKPNNITELGSTNNSNI